MVTLGSKRIHIAFTDSRGFELDHRVHRINSIYLRARGIGDGDVAFQYPRLIKYP